jgi:hypothetical protein
MGNLGTPSKPLLGLLAATVIVAVLWMVALRPGAGGSSASGSGGGLGAYQSAIDKARSSAAAQNRAAAAGGGSLATTSPTHAQPTAKPAASGPARVRQGSGAGTAARVRQGSGAGTAAPTATATRTPAAGARHPSVKHVRVGPVGHPSSAAGSPARVDAALRAGRVVALLFYNPGAADDQAVRSELLGLPVPRRVLRLAVPIGEVASYPEITEQLAIDDSPTLVIVDPRHQATVITGYASAYEIAQRLADALAVRPPAA